MSSPFIGSTAVASGLLTRGQLRWNYTAIHPDVYVPKGPEPTLDVRTRAAALWVPGGIIAGRANIRVVKEHGRGYILRRVDDAFTRRRISLAKSA